MLYAADGLRCRSAFAAKDFTTAVAVFDTKDSEFEHFAIERDERPALLRFRKRAASATWCFGGEKCGSEAARFGIEHPRMPSIGCEASRIEGSAWISAVGHKPTLDNQAEFARKLTFGPPRRVPDPTAGKTNRQPKRGLWCPTVRNASDTLCIARESYE